MALLAVLLIGATIFFAVRPQDFSEDLPATLKIVQGTAEVKSGSGSWQRAADLQPLQPGDSVRIGAGSVVFVNYFDGSTTRLNDQSELKLVSSRRAGTKPGLLPKLLSMFGGGEEAGELEADTEVSAMLLVGKALTRVQHLGSSKSTFQVQTPNMIAGVTGTVFETVIDPSSGELVWQVAEGSLLGTALLVDDATGQVAGALTSMLPNDSFRVKALPASLGQDTRAKLVDAGAAVVRDVSLQARGEGRVAPGSPPTLSSAAQQLGSKYVGVARDETSGKDRVLYSLAESVGKPVPTDTDKQRLMQSVPRILPDQMREAKVDGLNSITMPGRRLSLDWLEDWRGPGREILIVSETDINRGLAEAMKEVPNLGAVSVDIRAGNLIQLTVSKDPITGNPVNFTIGLSASGGKMQLTGLPPFLFGLNDQLKQEMPAVLVIRAELAGTMGHAGVDGRQTVRLTSDQLVLVMEAPGGTTRTR